MSPSFAIPSRLSILDVSIIMKRKKKIKSHPDVVEYFKEIPFYNKYIEKSKMKHLEKHWFAF